MDHMGKVLARGTVALLAFGLLGGRTAAPSESVDARGVYASANDAYLAERYDEAIDGYQRVIGSGLHHPDVYYNLGNAYYRKGALGRAIANYLRANRLAPRDRDVAHNLALAASQVRDRLPNAQGGLLRRWLTVVQQRLSLQEQAWLELLLYGAIFLALACGLFDPSRRAGLTRIAIVTACAWLAALGSLLIAVSHSAAGARGVVAAQSVDVRAAPSDHAAGRFTLHEGTICDILRRRDSWLEIRLGGEPSGWVPTRALEIL